MATLSILGMYEYDNTIMDGLINNLPTPDKVPVDSYPGLFYTPEALDSDALITELLLECAELEVLYPSSTTMAQAINVWAITHKKVWQDYYNTMWYRYNPIWNKDGTITRTETEERNLATSDATTGSDVEERNLTTEATSNSTRTDDLSENITRERNLTSSNDHKVAGYNSNTLVASTSDSGTEGGNETTTRTNTGTQKNETSLDQTDGGSTTYKHGTTRNGTDTGTITRTYKDVETGNIGITMTQQMIDAERETVKFNMYDMIISEFRERFCLLIY